MCRLPLWISISTSATEQENYEETDVRPFPILSKQSKVFLVYLFIDFQNNFRFCEYWFLLNQFKQTQYYFTAVFYVHTCTFIRWQFQGILTPSVQQ